MNFVEITSLNAARASANLAASTTGRKGNPSPTWGRPPKPARCLTALHDASGLSASWRARSGSALLDHGDRVRTLGQNFQIMAPRIAVDVS